MAKLLPAFLLFLVTGCAAQSRAAVVETTNKRPKVVVNPDTGLPLWMTAPDWWQEPRPPQTDKATSDQPQIMIDSRLYSITDYCAFRDENNAFQPLLFIEGHSIFSSQAGDRFLKSLMSLKSASVLTAPRITLTNGQSAWLVAGEFDEPTNRWTGIGLIVKPDLTPDGRVQIHFSAQNNAASEDHNFNVSGETTLLPGQSYVKVVELHDADVAIVFVMNVPMIRYPEPDQRTAG